MTWGEAWRLLNLLLTDPSSHITAAVSGWDYPVTREDLTLRDLYDLTHQINAKKTPKPYPRPWPKQTKKVLKPDAKLSQAEIIAALRKAGHTMPVPL